MESPFDRLVHEFDSDFWITSPAIQSHQKRAKMQDRHDPDQIYRGGGRSPRIRFTEHNAHGTMQSSTDGAGKQRGPDMSKRARLCGEKELKGQRYSTEFRRLQTELCKLQPQVRLAGSSFIIFFGVQSDMGIAGHSRAGLNRATNTLFPFTLSDRFQIRRTSV